LPHHASTLIVFKRTQPRSHLCDLERAFWQEKGLAMLTDALSRTTAELKAVRGTIRRYEQTRRTEE